MKDVTEAELLHTAAEGGVGGVADGGWSPSPPSATGLAVVAEPASPLFSRVAQVAERFHAMCAGVPAEDGGTPRKSAYASAAQRSTARAGGGAIAAERRGLLSGALL